MKNAKQITAMLTAFVLTTGITGISLAADEQWDETHQNETISESQDGWERWHGKGLSAIDVEGRRVLADHVTVDDGNVWVDNNGYNNGYLEFKNGTINNGKYYYKDKVIGGYGLQVGDRDIANDASKALVENSNINSNVEAANRGTVTIKNSNIKATYPGKNDGVVMATDHAVINLEGNNNNTYQAQEFFGTTDNGIIRLKGGTLVANNLRSLTNGSLVKTNSPDDEAGMGPFAVRYIKNHIHKGGIILQDNGIIRTKTGQIFSRGINDSSRSNALNSKSSGSITNNYISYQGGTIRFDDKYYSEAWLQSAASAMRGSRSNFIMAGTYADGSSVDIYNAAQNSKVLRDKVTVTTGKKNAIVGVSSNKAGTYKENGVYIDRKQSAFVSDGFRASQLNLGKGSNGVVVTGGKTVTLGGSYSGDLITVNGQSAKTTLGIGTAVNRTGYRNGSTKGYVRIGDTVVGNGRQYKLGDVSINDGSSLQTVSGTLTAGNVSNAGTLTVNSGTGLNVSALNTSGSGTVNINGSLTANTMNLSGKTTLKNNGTMDTNTVNIKEGANTKVYSPSGLSADEFNVDGTVSVYAPLKATNFTVNNHGRALIMESSNPEAQQINISSLSINGGGYVTGIDTLADNVTVTNKGTMTAHDVTVNGNLTADSGSQVSIDRLQAQNISSDGLLQTNGVVQADSVTIGNNSDLPEAEWNLGKNASVNVSHDITVAQNAILKATDSASITASKLNIQGTLDAEDAAVRSDIDVNNADAHLHHSQLNDSDIKVSGNSYVLIDGDSTVTGGGISNEGGILDIQDSTLQISHLTNENDNGEATHIKNTQITLTDSTDGTSSSLGGFRSGKISLEAGSVLKANNLWDATHASRTIDNGSGGSEQEEIADNSLVLAQDGYLETGFNQLFRNNNDESDNSVEANSKIDYKAGTAILNGTVSQDTLAKAQEGLVNNGSESETSFILNGTLTDAQGNAITHETVAEADQHNKFLVDGVTVDVNPEDDSYADINASALDIGNNSSLTIGDKVTLKSRTGGQLIQSSSTNPVQVVVKGTLTVGDAYYGNDSVSQLGNLDAEYSGNVNIQGGTVQLAGLELKYGSAYIGNDMNKNTVVEIDGGNGSLVNNGTLNIVNSTLRGGISWADAYNDEGRLDAKNSRIEGNVELKNSTGYNTLDNVTVQGNVNIATNGANTNINNLTIEAPAKGKAGLTVKDGSFVTFSGNLAVDGNVDLEGSASANTNQIAVKGLQLSNNANIYTKKLKSDSLSMSGQSAVHTDTADLANVSITGGRLNVGQSGTISGKDGSDALVVSKTDGFDANAELHGVTISDGAVRAENGGAIKIDHSTVKADVLADAADISLTNTKITSGNLTANNNGHITFDASDSGFVYAPTTIGGDAKDSIVINGGTLKAPNLREMTRDAADGSVDVAKTGVIETTTNQIFSSGLNGSSKQNALNSKYAGYINNKKLDYQHRGTIRFDDKYYSEAWLKSAAKAMDNTETWFTMAGTYADGKSVDIYKAINNGNVLRDKVTVTTGKKNVVIGVDSKKAGSYRESGISIDKGQSAFVRWGFRAAKLNLGKGSNGVVVTNDEAMTLGGSDSGDLITVNGKSANTTLVIGTTANRTGSRGGSTRGEVLIGDTAVGKNSKYKLSNVKINSGGILRTVSGSLTAGNVSNYGEIETNTATPVKMSRLDLGGQGRVNANGDITAGTITVAKGAKANINQGTWSTLNAGKLQVDGNLNLSAADDEVTINDVQVRTNGNLTFVYNNKLVDGNNDDDNAVYLTLKNVLVSKGGTLQFANQNNDFSIKTNAIVVDGGTLKMSSDSDVSMDGDLILKNKANATLDGLDLYSGELRQDATSSVTVPYYLNVENYYDSQGKTYIGKNAEFTAGILNLHGNADFKADGSVYANIKVLDNAKLNFNNGKFLGIDKNKPIQIVDNGQVIFGDNSSAYTTASEGNNVSAHMVASVIENYSKNSNAVTISPKSKLFVDGALTDGTKYDLSEVVWNKSGKNSDAMWKNIYGNSTLVKGHPVYHTDHLYTFNAISANEAGAMYSKLMPVKAMLKAVVSTTPVNAASLTEKKVTKLAAAQTGSADQAEAKTKAAAFVTSVTGPASTVESTTNALNNAAGLSGLAGISHGVYSFANMVDSAISSKNVSSDDVWAEYIRKNEDVNGFKIGTMKADYDLDYSGAAVGYNFYKTDHSRTGMAFAYADGKVSSHGNNVFTRNDVDYYAGDFYHLLQNGDYTWKFDAGYIHSKNDLKQYNSGSRITGSVDADAYTAGIGVQKDIHFGYSTFTPFAGLRYLYLKSNDFTDSLGFSHKTDHASIWNLPIGLRLEHQSQHGDWQIKPELEVGYSFAFGDKDVRENYSYLGSGDYFNTDVAENNWFVKTGLQLQKGNTTFTGYYRYQKGNDTKANQWGGQLGYRF